MSYEPRDASVLVIGVSAGILAFLVAASIGTAAWFYTGQYGGSTAVPTLGRAGSFHFGPNEQLGIVEDYTDVTRSAREHLTRYGWVDRPHGIARIPVERAMELLVAGAKPAPAPQEPGQVP